MLSIRLSRKGKRKQPIYRVIICEKQKDPWGNYLENLGWYNPRSKELELKADRIKYWLEKGAQASPTVWNMLIEKGIVEGKKQKVSKISKKRSAKEAEKKAKEAPAEEPKAEEAKEEVPAEESKTEEVKEDTPAEESKVEEVKAEPPAEEPKDEEAPAEESKTEEVKEEEK